MNTTTKTTNYMTIPSSYIVNYKINWEKLEHDFKELINNEHTYHNIIDLKINDISGLLSKEIIISNDRNKTGHFFIKFDIDGSKISFLFSKSMYFDFPTRVNSVNDFIKIMSDNL